MNVASVTRALQETLAALDEEIKVAHARVEVLELERQGVQAALKRFAGEPSPPRPPTAPRSHPPLAWRAPTDQGGLSERVLSLLRGADEPVSVSEVVESTGLTKEQARSALGYLSRKGMAEKAGGRGLWQPTSSTDADAAPATTTGAASGSIHQIMNGGDASGTGSNRVRDDDLLWETDHRVHHHGAPVVRGE